MLSKLLRVITFKGSWMHALVTSISKPLIFWIRSWKFSHQVQWTHIYRRYRRLWRALRCRLSTLGRSLLVSKYSATFLAHVCSWRFRNDVSTVGYVFEVFLLVIRLKDRKRSTTGSRANQSFLQSPWCYLARDTFLLGHVYQYGLWMPT